MKRQFFSLHPANDSMFLCVFIISSFIFFVTVRSEVSEDVFSDFRSTSMNYNPTRTVKPETYAAIDLYQPYYICGGDDDSEALSPNEWHYSCKQACSDVNDRHMVNITRMKWDYIGTNIDVYKVITVKTCWTSHVNIWGVCSHTSSTFPTATENEDLALLKDQYVGPNVTPKLGMQHITNSHRADCSYFSDNLRCDRDYTIYHRKGKVSKKSDTDPAVLNIYSDGIRVSPSEGSVHLNDVSYMWDASSASSSDECGWKETKDTSCSYVETSDTLKCDDIGYTYNLHDMYHKKTCGGDIYDLDGPSPFKYLTKEIMKRREKIVGDAKVGKSDPDVAFITGINYAFSELESTYCSSSCDLFARVNPSTSDHVLDTPIGAWRVQTSPTLHPKMLPCMPTSNWTIKKPMTMCSGENTILVIDKDTGHVNLWDAGKDYIILDQLCGGKQDQARKRYNMLKDKMKRNEKFEISFWNGDAVVVEPPYMSPKWKRSSHHVHTNPSWFAKVKLDKSMIHSKDDISSMLTDYVKTTAEEIRHTNGTSKTVYKFLADEVLEGIESVGTSIWGGITGFFGNMTKIITMLLIIIILLLCGKLALIIRKFSRTKKKKVQKSRTFVESIYQNQDKKRHVTWAPDSSTELEQEVASGQPQYDSTRNLTMASRRTLTSSNKRNELAKLLNV
ncbi:MAG: glycoprotein [Betanucleorhabdovirus picridis]|uniref:Glycoprotein n=1 Tax=Picris betanucleorhabdovirus 1 TaxID=2950849 RepID=A0AAE9MRJ0_9RHAB|nr:MAG: glycoprotein [Picris betanucleorhabdovirus 1]